MLVAAFAAARCGSGSPTQATGPRVSGLALASSSVGVGTAIQANVTLSAAAETGGAVVSLSSSNPAVAMVETRVTVAAGASSPTFTVAARSVGATTIPAAMS